MLIAQTVSNEITQCRINTFKSKYMSRIWQHKRDNSKDFPLVIALTCKVIQH